MKRRADRAARRILTMGDACRHRPPSDQLIVSFFCPTGAFFGNVSDSTPS